MKSKINKWSVQYYHQDDAGELVPSWKVELEGFNEDIFKKVKKAVDYQALALGFAAYDIFVTDNDCNLKDCKVYSDLTLNYKLTETKQ